MCVIIVKPRKTCLPKLSVLKQCWTSNGDGAGIMYNTSVGIIISKGFMRFDDLVAALKAIPNPVDKNIVIHMRVATHGTVCPENTHPFPASTDVSDLKALGIVCRTGIAHNGVISGFGTRPKYSYYTDDDDDYGDWGNVSYNPGSPAYKWDLVTKTLALPEKTTALAPATVITPAPKAPESPLSDLSDTQEFIIEYLATLGRSICNESVRDLIAWATGSKFAILTGKSFYTIGTFTKKHGCYYSNTFWDYAPKAVTIPANPTAIGEAPGESTRSPQVEYTNADDLLADAYATWKLQRMRQEDIINFVNAYESNDWAEVYKLCHDAGADTRLRDYKIDALYTLLWRTQYGDCM
ncbi:MAG: hypothetical protein TUN42_04335 [Dehalogenimonas sp.]